LSTTASVSQAKPNNIAIFIEKPLQATTYVQKPILGVVVEGKGHQNALKTLGFVLLDLKEQSTALLG
jgi:hypothetical protein